MTTPISTLIQSVNENSIGVFERKPVCIVVLPDTLAESFDLKRGVYLSEFVIAKVKGRIPTVNHHIEITDNLLLDVPRLLADPYEVISDERNQKRKRLFVEIEPRRLLVVEICREPSGHDEINTIHLLHENELKKLETRFPVIYRRSAGGTPTTPHRTLV